MRDVFHEQLDLLADQLNDMAQMVGDAMETATVGISEVDLGSANRVITEAARVDQARAETEDHAYAILALQAPVATDLRIVVAAIHAARKLERMGDLAVHVAEAVRRRHPRPVVPPPLMPRFAEMGRIAVWAARTAGDVIRTQDTGLARTLEEADDDMDDLYRTLFTVIDYREWAYGTTTAVDVSLLSRFYERFADHAVSLARQTTFIVTGQPRWAGQIPLQDHIARATGIRSV
jgi:phosphate transport system protein